MKLLGFMTALVLVSSAGVNAQKLGIFDWNFRAPSLSDPAAIDPKTKGDMVYDSTNDTFLGWNGTSWVDFGASGSGTVSYRPISSTDSTTSTDDVVSLSGSAFTLTLSAATGNQGKILQIVHDGSNFVGYTLATTGGETIGGIASGSYKLYTNGESLKIVSDGTNWKILEHKTATEWTAFTPTIGSAFGSATSKNGTWRRIGDSMEVMVSFVAGTTTTGGNHVLLPGSVSVDTSKQVPNGGSNKFPVVGNWGNGGNASPDVVVFDSANPTFLDCSTDGHTVVNGNTCSTSSQYNNLHATVPVSDWRP